MVTNLLMKGINMVVQEVKLEIEEHVVPKVKWYLKYRTQIWSTIFMVVGVLGGSVATIQSYIPGLKYDAATIETKLKQLDEMSDQLIKIQETLDKLSK